MLPQSISTRVSILYPWHLAHARLFFVHLATLGFAANRTWIAQPGNMISPSSLQFQFLLGFIGAMVFEVNCQENGDKSDH